MTSRKDWDRFAREQGLPSSYTLMKHLGSWRSVKEYYNVPTRRRILVDEDRLSELLMNHKEFMLTTVSWDEYAVKHELPSSRTIINHFGSWTNAQLKIGIDPTPKFAPQSYEREEIIKKLKAHPKSYQNQLQWNSYAKLNNLPAYKTIRKHLTFEEFQQLVGVDSKM